MIVPAISVSTASARMALTSTNVCVLQDIQVCFAWWTIKITIMTNKKLCRLN